MLLQGVQPLIRAFIVGTILFLFILQPTQAEKPEIAWKTLPEYMAMNRDAQRQLISSTTRTIMLQLAKTDFPRAECVSWLFNFDTEEGRQQFYNTKGLLKAAAEDGSTWKAQQIVAYVITKKFCPALSSN